MVVAELVAVAAGVIGAVATATTVPVVVGGIGSRYVYSGFNLDDGGPGIIAATVATDTKP